MFSRDEREQIRAALVRAAQVDFNVTGAAQLSDDDLNTISIDRSDVGYIRKAGDFILRIAYHEAVHAGQMLQYLRMAGVPRPSVWD